VTAIKLNAPSVKLASESCASSVKTSACHRRITLAHLAAASNDIHQLIISIGHSKSDNARIARRGGIKSNKLNMRARSAHIAYHMAASRAMCGIAAHLSWRGMARHQHRQRAASINWRRGIKAASGGNRSASKACIVSVTSIAMALCSPSSSWRHHRRQNKHRHRNNRLWLKQTAMPSEITSIKRGQKRSASPHVRLRLRTYNINTRYYTVVASRDIRSLYRGSCVYRVIAHQFIVSYHHQQYQHRICVYRR